jgi:hypothetical protein
LDESQRCKVKQISDELHPPLRKTVMLGVYQITDKLRDNLCSTIGASLAKRTCARNITYSLYIFPDWRFLKFIFSAHFTFIS